MPKRSFLQGALILTLGSLLSRLLGMVYRIFLPWLMGSGQQAQIGMGLFGMAYPVYTIILSISAAGVPLAISKMVSERSIAGDRTSILQILRLSVILLAGVGLLASVLLLLVSPYLATAIMKDPRASLSISAIAPAIIFVSIMSAYRGFFQGLQDMVPHASSQVIEQTVRVSTMFVFAYLLLPMGIEYAAAGATFGAVTGAIGGLGYLMWTYKRKAGMLLDGLPVEQPVNGAVTVVSSAHMLVRLLQLAVPISLSSMILPLMNLIDAAVVPLRLHAGGFTTHQSTAMFGILTGFAMPFVVMPTVFTAALSMSLLPSISEADALKLKDVVQKRVRTGVRVALMIGFPAAAGLIVLSREIPSLFYDTPQAGWPLAVLAAGLVFISLQQTTSGILQGLGQPVVPMRNLLIGASVKLALTWILTAVPQWNIVGAAAATTIGFGLACLLNLVEVNRKVAGSSLWIQFLKPLAAASVMAVAVDLVRRALLEQELIITVGASILVGILVYPVTLLLIRGVEKEELQLIFSRGFGAKKNG